MSDFTIKDSGQRQAYGGGVRDTEDGKIDYSLALDGPMFERWAQHLTRGAKKYAPRNWMKFSGLEALQRAKRSALRHFLQWFRGEQDEDHAAGVFFNINVAEHLKDGAGVPNPAGPADAPLPLSSTLCAMCGQRFQYIDGQTPVVRCSRCQSPQGKPLKIYVAGPFSALTSEGRERNRKIASQVGLYLATRGHLVHVPHNATAPWHNKLSYEDFMRLDLSIIRDWADAVFWIKSSPGANRERDEAVRCGKLVFTQPHEVPILPRLGSSTGVCPCDSCFRSFLHSVR